MSVAILPAHDFTTAQLASLFTLAYEGYIAGSYQADAPTLAQMLSSHGVDLWLSRVVTLDREPVGFGFVNRTGNLARLASLGIIGPARRQGLARRLMHRLLEESRERGEAAMMLEVIQQNPAAVALYESLGFQIEATLLGWRWTSATAGTQHLDHAQDVVALPLLDLAQAGSFLDYPRLPWQASRHFAAKAPPGSRAFGTPHGRLLITDPAQDPIRIYAVLSEQDDHQAWPAIRRVLAEMMRRFPSRTWWAPAVFLEKQGRAVFEPLGFLLEPLSQFLMRKSF